MRGGGSGWSIAAVFEEVNRRHVQFGLVPLENSTDGRVIDTLEMFTRLPNLKIRAEVRLRIRQEFPTLHLCLAVDDFCLGLSLRVLDRGFFPRLRFQFRLLNLLLLEWQRVLHRIAVRVQLWVAERRFELAVIGVAFDFEGLVIAALGRHPFKPARTSSSLPNVEDASFGLMKNDPHTIETRCALFGMRVMVVIRL